MSERMYCLKHPTLLGRQLARGRILVSHSQLGCGYTGGNAADGTEMGLRHERTLEVRDLLLTLLPMLHLLAANQRDHQGQAGKQTLLQAQWRYMQLAEALASHADVLPHSDYSLGEVLQSACQLFIKIKINKISKLRNKRLTRMQHPARCPPKGRAKCTMTSSRIKGSKATVRLPKWQDGMKTPLGGAL